MPWVVNAKRVTTASDVLPIGRHPRVFPAGVEARHEHLGWVLVERVRGNERLVRWYDFREMRETESRESADPDRQRPKDWQWLKQFGALLLAPERFVRNVRLRELPDLPNWLLEGR